jgi:MFS family permease
MFEIMTRKQTKMHLFTKKLELGLKKIDNLGPKSPIYLFFCSAIAIICNLSLSVWMYAFFPLEKKWLMFFIWALLGITGAYFFGWVSDNISRKRTLLLTQILGTLGIWILREHGFNLFIIMLISFLYNPTPVLNASLITYNQKNNYKIQNGRRVDKHQNPKMIAFSVLCQAFPWLFFGKIQEIGSSHFINFLFWFSLISLIIVVFLFKEPRLLFEKKSVNHKKIISFSIPLLFSFLLAESVYFISALEFGGNTFFILAGTGVTTGALIHFLPHKDYHLSYPSLISASYFLGGLLMFLGVIGGILMKNESSIQVFVGIIACIGAIYIPLVSDIEQSQ